MSKVVVTLSAFCWAATAHADPLVSRDDALTPARGSWSVGVFNPARYAATDNVEVQTHPLIFLIAPHGEVHIRHDVIGPWQITGLYGVSMPSLAMRLLSGYLFPSFDRDGGTLGWTLVPKIGVLASRGVTDSRVLTLKADLAIGVPLVPTDARPLQAPQPLDLLFTPVLSGYRVRAGVLYDARIRDAIRARVYADAFAHGIDQTNTEGVMSHFTFRVGGGVDFKLGRHGRLALGLVVWNSFQHAIDSQGRPKRSTDPLPVLDFIWAN